MSDLVKRLRAWGPLVSSGYECPAAGTAMHEAAAEIKKLRAALREIVDCHMYSTRPWDIARVALEGEGK